MHADFRFSPDQLELQAAAARLFAADATIVAVRAAQASADGYDTGLWSQMAELGWVGLNLPVELGGGGGGYVDLYALFEVLGRHLVPLPLLDVVVAGMAVTRWGDEEQRHRLLPSLANGTMTVTLGLADSWGRVAPTCTLSNPEGTAPLVNGRVELAAFARTSSYLMCGLQGRPELVLVDLRDPGVTVTPVDNLPGLPLASVEVDAVPLSRCSVIRADDDRSPWRALGLLGGVLQAAYGVGAAHSVLDMTNQYAKDRMQFGIPIGQNQAVQYLVSDILIDLHSTDLLARHAAYRIERGLPFEREAVIAIAHGKAASAHLHRQAHEVHAGVGFMEEHPLPTFSRHAKFLENNLGDARFYFDQLAALLCDAPVD